MALTKLKTSGIADDAVTTDKLANAINTERTANTAKVSLGADSVTGAKIADDAVGAEHIEQLDADLSFADSAKAKFGASNDLEISHDGSNSKIHHGGSGGLKVTCDDFQVQKNDGSEWIMRGQADGAVSLYHDNIKKLDTRSDGIIVWGPEGGDAQLRLTADEGDDGADYWRLESNASSNNFNLATHAGGSWVDKVTVDSSGNATLNSGSLILSTAGQGIEFHPSGASNVNLLDDYEEGTWTPVLYVDGASSSSGKYTKIGRMVYATFQIVANSSSSGTHQYISGLPFTTHNAVPNAGGVARDYQTYDVENGPVYHVSQDDTIIYLYKNGGQNLSGSNLSGLQIRGTAVYTAA